MYAVELHRMRFYQFFQNFERGQKVNRMSLACVDFVTDGDQYESQ